MRLDIVADDIEAEVHRLQALGARRIESAMPSFGGARWVRMSDPEQNGFASSPASNGKACARKDSNHFGSSGQLHHISHPQAGVGHLLFGCRLSLSDVSASYGSNASSGLPPCSGASAKWSAR